MGVEERGFSPARRGFLKDAGKALLGLTAFAVIFNNSVARALANIVNPVLSKHVEKFCVRALSYLEQNHKTFVKSLSDEQATALSDAITDTAAHMFVSESSFYDGFGKNPEDFAEKCLKVFDDMCQKQGASLNNSQRVKSKEVLGDLASYLATTKI